MTLRKVFRGMFPLRNEESAFGRSYVYVDLRHKDIKYQQCYRLTPLLMTLKLVSSLVPGNKKLPIGKPETSFDCFLLFPTSPAPSQNSCRTQQCTSLDQFNGNAYLNGSHVVIKVDGTSFSDAGSLVTTVHLTREICPRDLNYRKSKTNMGAQKLLLTRCFFFLSVRDWIKTKVVLWASVVKQFSMRQKNTFCSSMPEIQGQSFHQCGDQSCRRSRSVTI